MEEPQKETEEVIHYTLNTGHSVEQSDTPPPGIVEAMRPLLSGGSLGQVAQSLSAFRVEVVHGDRGAVWTVFRGKDPIVTCGLAWSAESAAEVWESIERLYFTLSDQHPEAFAPAQIPEQPVKLPWLAVVVLPYLLLQPGDTAGWLGDFERCMAWTILAAK